MITTTIQIYSDVPVHVRVAIAKCGPDPNRDDDTIDTTAEETPELPPSRPPLQLVKAA